MSTTIKSLVDSQRGHSGKDKRHAKKGKKRARMKAKRAARFVKPEILDKPGEYE